MRVPEGIRYEPLGVEYTFPELPSFSFLCYTTPLSGASSRPADASDTKGSPEHRVEGVETALRVMHGDGVVQKHPRLRTRDCPLAFSAVS